MALKLNTKTASTKTTSTTTPVRASEVATTFRRVALESDALEARLKILRSELLEIVTEFRNGNLTKGIAESSVSIPTADGNKVLVVYPEKYKSLSIDNVPALKDAFGDKYDLFCEETREINLKENVGINELKAVVGDRFDALMALFDVKDAVKPRKGAFENIAALHKDGRVETAADLTMFVDATIGSPTVRK